MASRYVVVTPDGTRRVLSQEEVCDAIIAQRLDLDATFAPEGSTDFAPITQHGPFKLAFERRMGLSGQAAHSSGATPESASTAVSATAVQTHPGAMDDVEPRTPVTDGAGSDTLPAVVHPDESFDTADLALTSDEEPMPSGTFPPADPAPIGHGASPPPVATTEPRSQRLLVMFGAWALVTAALFTASIVLSGGRAEAEWRPDSAVLWVRIALTGGLGAVLALAFNSSLPITSRQLRLTWQWAAIAILAGSAVGVMAPSVPAASPSFVAIVLAATVAIAEEIFFRGFLGRVLAANLVHARSALAAGAILYGLYYGTYFVIWQRPSALETGLALTMITVGAGLPYALFQDLTKGVTASLLCHVAVNVVGVLTH